MLQPMRRMVHRFVLRPLVRRALRLQVTGAGRLDRSGPAIIVANHNSHVDTAVLMAVFPTDRIHRVRPVAAADYFLRNRVLAWFTTRIVGIVPIRRRICCDTDGGSDPLAGAAEALSAGDMLVLFPEGTRGEPGIFGELKSGVARLALRHPGVPVFPVWLEGCERTMPKGARFPHPAPCAATVGMPLFPRPGEQAAELLDRIRTGMLALRPGSEVAA